jgi:hypothetical protein
MSIFSWKSRKAEAPAAAAEISVVAAVPAAEVAPAPAAAEPASPPELPTVQPEPRPPAAIEAPAAAAPEPAASQAAAPVVITPAPEPKPQAPEPLALVAAPEPEAAVEPEAGVDAAQVAEPAPSTAAAPEFSLLAAVDQVMAEPPTWPEDPLPEPPRPNDTIEALLTLTRQGQPAMELPISADILGNIIDNLPDHQTLEGLYDLAAEHPSAQVRLAVARKDRLGEDAVRKLAEAREFYVLERLLASDQFRAQVSQERLLAIMDLHPELARDVAGSYASYLNCAASALLATLGSHRDPGVRLALVENYSASAALLRGFATDPDPGVRAAAKRRLTEA